MKVDLYAITGEKKGSLELPSSMFEVPVNKGLMHLALVRQQSNRRHPVAHAKGRGEMQGSTKKLFQQKGTGRARRGPVRSPLLRGGGKAFGPKSNANYQKDMPRKMRRAALFSCLSLRAKDGVIVGLESFPDDVKTKTFADFCKKLKLPVGRRIIIVHADAHRGLQLSARNVDGVKTLPAAYLNPEDVLQAHSIVFLKDAVKKAEEVFGAKEKMQKTERMEKTEKSEKKTTVKKTTTSNQQSATNEKKSSSSSASSSSSPSSK